MQIMKKVLVRAFFLVKDSCGKPQVGLYKILMQIILPFLCHIFILLLNQF